ncbi:MAG: hypothetical protein HYX34_03105 [Actinobacteria bacterium]|nr:hypothetical protein [Actinomycetota bacterium]
MAIAVVSGIALVACSGSNSSNSNGNGSEGRDGSPPLRGTIAVSAEAPQRCDPLGGGECLLPFPNDYFTVADRTTATGRRIAFDRASMPANVQGVRMDPAEWNRNDGFSPGSAVAVLVPGLDLARSAIPASTDIGASLRRDAPVVVVDAATGRRTPLWGELDATSADPARRLLLVRPARALVEGHRYVVALRGLRTRTGSVISAPPAFRAYRDRLDTRDGRLEARRAAMERTLSDLARAGVGRNDLYLAWDFTVASGRSLSERVLAMRDDAFRRLGDRAPRFTVTAVQPGSGSVLRTVKGTVEVPKYLTGDGAPGSVLDNGAGPGDPPIPRANGTFRARFTCSIPASAVRAGVAQPTRLALYGHGLLGSADEVLGAGAVFGSASNTTFCATDWIGMAAEDIPVAAGILAELGRFRTLPDRLQQAMINFLYLGRVMKRTDGFGSDRSFQDASGRSLLGTDLTFVGLSQGGIIGGALSAIAQDWRRALLGVPAMNYSTLLNRSIDFDQFAAILNPAYPDPVTRQLGLLLVQMLWDRGENDGYAQHLTSDPYRQTPTKQVLVFEAFGDHQVANVATEVMARTIGARLRTPALASGRSRDRQPLWGIAPAGRLPAAGRSYLVLWDFGTPAPPPDNRPNRAGEDPHGAGRDDPDVLRMTAAFLSEGRLIDVCRGAPCRSAP